MVPGSPGSWTQDFEFLVNLFLFLFFFGFETQFLFFFSFFAFLFTFLFSYFVHANFKTASEPKKQNV